MGADCRGPGRRAGQGRVTPEKIAEYWRRFFAAKDAGELRALARELVELYPDDPALGNFCESIAMALLAEGHDPGARAEG